MSLLFKQLPGPTDDSPVLLLLHGLGSDENDLIAIAPELRLPFEIVSVRAPHETGYGGYSWFHIEFLPDGSRSIDPEQALASRDLVLSFCRRFAGRKLILAGFSQGAMIASGVLLQSPEAVEGALLMSGRWLPHFAVGSEAVGKPVLVQHGTYDPVLRVEEGRELAEAVRSHGHQVEYLEYPMAHQISFESLMDAKRFLSGLCC